MKIKPFPLMLCRTPAFALEDELNAVWEDLKAKIKSSSPTFHQLIAPTTFTQLNELNEKAQFTIWKYFNRAKYRATPFGAFAAFSTLALAEGSQLQIQRQMVLHQFISWEEKESYSSPSISVLQNSNYVQRNSSIYEVGNEIRYICFREGQFQLSAVQHFPELQLVLQLCQTQAPLALVYSQLQAQFNLNKKSCTHFFAQLLDLQLISVDALPNITGTDYFERIRVKQAQNEPYLLAERSLAGTFDEKKLKDVPELINFLANIQSTQGPRDLHDFKTAFLKKYEHRQIPLAIAMDPELGIGYGNLAQQCSDNELLETLRASQSAGMRSTHAMDFTELHAFLLNEIVAGKTIQLEAFKQNTKAQWPLPNTLSVLFHTYQEQLVVEHVGGCTANALMGRFTLASPLLEQYGQSIAQLESEANPEVLFFDIAYQVEQNIDNVNRRKQLYPLELPILSWSLAPEQLDLADMLVTVVNNEVVLYSKKRGKRLIPRLPSAYNYTRSDLSLYRFLCDLQHQGICSGLQFCLKDYFPKLKHYPRVAYKNTIISPAQWLLPNAYVQQQKGETLLMALDRLKAWLNAQAIHQPFKAGNGDLTLTFDPKNAADLSALLNYAKQQNGLDFYLTEALIHRADGLQDADGKHYCPQYVVNYYHQEKIYEPHFATQAHGQWLATDIKFLGGEWLYFEIYCHPNRSNQLLLEQIQTFLKQHQACLKQWFFIRYDEPSPHLRLRLNVKQPAALAQLMFAFKALFKPLLLSALITNVELKTYYRETQRYGANRIDLTERFFHVDSKQCLRLLAKAKTHDELYVYALQQMQVLCSTYHTCLQQQLAFVSKVAHSFAQEMDMNTDTFKKVNMAFATFKQNGYLAQANELSPKPVVQKLWHTILTKCSHAAEKEQLLADFIHMHINRLFISDQRKHETILYHYLLKMLQTKLALLKRSAEYLYQP